MTRWSSTILRLALSRMSSSTLLLVTNLQATAAAAARQGVCFLLCVVTVGP
jgi:hypothetical protein